VTKRLAILLALLLGGCGTSAPAPRGERPMRIVSLDYCADQYLLKLVGRDRMLAVSPDAEGAFSYMRAAARGVRQVAPRAEDVLVLRPDLIVRSYGGGPNAAALFERAGVPVLQLGYANDLKGIRDVLVQTADGLGEGARGRAIAAEMDARIARVPAKAGKALYMTPGGVTSGPGSLVDAMFRAAGLENFEAEPGWRSLPLERLAYDRPDLIAYATFGSADPWSAARHPVARRQVRDRPTVTLDGAWTACGGWFVLDAVEKLARR
jgi:iron complex transport system substrate-binding protein